MQLEIQLQVVAIILSSSGDQNVEKQIVYSIAGIYTKKNDDNIKQLLVFIFVFKKGLVIIFLSMLSKN